MLGGFTGGDGLLVRPVEPHVEFEVAGVGGGLGAHRLDEPFDGAERRVKHRGRTLVL
jgi:hypothetical protein